jgi:hypothetical protein
MGTPSQIEGPALVVLPRTCVLDRDVYGPLGSKPTRGRGARTSLELRRAVDAMVAGVQSTTLPADTCSPLPDPSRETARLARLRASPDVLRMMRERGVQHAVVIQIETTLACADPLGSGLYAGGGIGMAAHVVRDECDEENLRLFAIVFADDGTAVWAGRRTIEPGARVEHAVERLLRRVPVAVPLRTSDRIRRQSRRIEPA